MSIEDGLLPSWFLLFICLPCLAIVVFAIRQVNWQALRGYPFLQHLFALSILVLTVLWSMRAGLSSGLAIHFLGLTAATLLMGWPLALLAGALVNIALIILGLETASAFAVNFVFYVALPVFTSHLLLHQVQKRLPANPFIYIFLCGFFNGALSILIVALATALMLGGLGIYEWYRVYHEYLMYLPLLLFPEAFINGMIVAGIIGTKPELLSSFNVDKYFSDD